MELNNQFNENNYESNDDTQNMLLKRIKAGEEIFTFFEKWLTGICWDKEEGSDLDNFYALIEEYVRIFREYISYDDFKGLLLSYKTEEKYSSKIEKYSYRATYVSEYLIDKNY